MHCAHPFEAAGLGKAPYRKGKPFIIVGAEHCCLCGTAIQNQFHFLSRDGEHFFVGSTCVGKELPEYGWVQSELRAHYQKLQRQRKSEKQQRFDAHWARYRAELHAQPWWPAYEGLVKRLHEINPRMPIHGDEWIDVQKTYEEALARYTK